MNHEFAFELGQRVAVEMSGEQGGVIARAEYLNSADTYLIRYRSADGRAVEQWWTADALVPVAAQ